MLKYIIVCIANGVFVSFAWLALDMLQIAIGLQPSPKDYGLVTFAAAAGGGNAYLWTRED